MSEENQRIDAMFVQLVFSLHSAAMQQMGKVMSPITGKVERDLEMARHSIELLAMLQRKTQGNLEAEEKQLLDRMLYELRMNFVDESKKPQPSTDETKKSETKGTDSRSESEANQAEPDSESGTEN